MFCGLIRRPSSVQPHANFVKQRATSCNEGHEAWKVTPGIAVLIRMRLCSLCSSTSLCDCDSSAIYYTNFCLFFRVDWEPQVDLTSCQYVGTSFPPLPIKAQNSYGVNDLIRFYVQYYRISLTPEGRPARSRSTPDGHLQPLAGIPDSFPAASACRHRSTPTDKGSKKIHNTTTQRNTELSAVRKIWLIYLSAPKLLPSFGLSLRHRRCEATSTGNSEAVHVPPF